jgi:phosphoglycolate phosphatase
MKSGQYTHVIWDWNGTLIDDAWLCVEVMNSILKEYELPLLTLERYRDLFDFPVKNYYQRLGFDFDLVPFDEVGMEFMHRYNARHQEVSLFPEVRHVLDFVLHKGMTQSILSAREHNELLLETEKLEVKPYFSRIFGIDDYYAHGKVDVGFQLIRELDHPKHEILFVGDTSHDAEVAREIGVDCLLIPTGHQAIKRIRQVGVPTVGSLRDFASLL